MIGRREGYFVKRRTWIVGAVVVGAVAVLGGLVALAKDAPESKAVRADELSGVWRLDASRSDMPRRPDGAGGRTGSRRGDGARSGGGEWAGRGPGQGAGPRGQRVGRLPETIKVEQSAGTVSFTDSTGAALFVITTGAAAKTAADVPRLAGRWVGGHLEIEREGWRGAATKQTYSVEDEGRTLVILTKMPGDGSRPAREMRRVYRRMGT